MPGLTLCLLVLLLLLSCQYKANLCHQAQNGQQVGRQQTQKGAAAQIAGIMCGPGVTTKHINRLSTAVTDGMEDNRVKKLPDW